MLTSKHYNEISRDLKKSAAENRARYEAAQDELQCREARADGIRVFFIGLALVVIVALIESFAL